MGNSQDMETWPEENCMAFCTPRRSTHRPMTLPTNSSGVRMVAAAMGSRTSAHWAGSRDGLSTFRTAPSAPTTS